MELKTKIIAEEGKQELFIVREFDLPVELLFKACTDPELLVRWMSNSHSEMVVEKLENRPHGGWRYVHTDKAGNKYCFNGVIHAFKAPHLIIRTFEIENTSGGDNVQLEYTTFEKLTDDTSRLTVHTLYRSNADRDTMIKYGMEKGANMAHNKLQEVMNTLK